MRLRSRTWYGISLALFAAAILTWRYAERRTASHPALAKGSAARSAALGLRHPALLPVMATNGAGGVKSYRLSNTTQTLGQLLRNNHAIILRNALIDTETPVGMKIPAHLRAQGAPGSYLVQADRALDKDFYAELSRAGATYVSYVPNNTALVEATPEEAQVLGHEADVIAVLPYQPYYKLDSTLLPSAVEQEPQTNALSVTTFPGQREAALNALTKLGATLLGEDSGPFGSTLIVRVPPDALVAVAQLPLAQEIEAYSPRRLLNDLSRVDLGVSTDTLLGTPNYDNLNGSNVTVNLNDSGVDATHPDLIKRLLGDAGSLIDDDGHGTHVAGIIAGSGAASGTVTIPPQGSVANADYRGKATNAFLFVQALDLLYGPYVSDTFLQQTASQNLGPTNLISNNSWGYASTTYDTHSASFDAATRDAQPGTPGEQPLLFVFAAGNDGQGDNTGVDGQADTITSPGTAKNVITVGAVDTPRFLTNQVSYDLMTTNPVFYGETDNSNLVAYFSSCGNVGVGIEGAYGRFKPDVVAPGVFIVSCRSTNYVDPTNQDIEYLTPYPSQTLLPGQTNYYAYPVPSNAIELVVQITPNTNSPAPFPGLTLLGDTATPPTVFLTTNNLIVLTNGGPNSLNPPSTWYFALTPPTNDVQPIGYDLNFYLLETNYLGDYYTVLSNMNSTLAPAYRYETGTSMAAPAVSGLLALMQDFLENQLKITPSPALMKALLINGSRSLGNLYSFAVNTEGANEEGWGLPNLGNIIPPSLTNSSATPSLYFLDQSPTNALATGQSQSYILNSADPTVQNIYPIRISLVWTDPPGNPAAGVALVNDLDLVVTDASSNIFIGNDFEDGTSTPPSTATNLYPSDTVNNVENVYIYPGYTPVTFPLTITVKGTRVNVNAVTTQTNQIAQDYALVVSSDDPAPTSFAVMPQPIVTNVPTLITIASNGVPLLHQRVGANDPNLYSPPYLTNGNISQWHFFIFTNTAFNSTNQATNVAITTFMPPNLSLPRATEADIDLYVSTSAQLLNLNPRIVTLSYKSLSRGGTESIFFTNSTPNEVYYVGVKSEDQQAADFGFYAVAQQAPFSTVNNNGEVVAQGTSLPVTIPDSVAGPPALVFAFVFNPGIPFLEVRRVTVDLGIVHGNPSDLYGTVQHDGLQDVLNHHSGSPGGFTNTYDDLNEGTGTVPSDGPGSLTEYVGQSGLGLWLLTETDEALAQAGQVVQYTITIDPQPLLSGFTITLGPNQWFDDYVDVPNDATNLIISGIYESNSGGTIGIYLTNADNLNTGDYGTNINPPGGALSLSTNPPPATPPTYYPPLSGGTWYFGLYNPGPGSVTLYVQVQIEESLTPNLVQSYSNNAVTPLLTDATTDSTICVTNGQVSALQVGVRLFDTNLDDLVLHLISPQGTRVLLFEDRGGSNAVNLGLSLTNGQTTNLVYTVFTEDTNLTTTPIKFAPPPYAQSNYVPSAVLSSNSFDSTAVGVYTNGQYVSGWLVTNTYVPIATTNGPALGTNDEVGIAASPTEITLGTNLLGINYLALTSGRIVRSFTVSNDVPYELIFAARGPGITDWWPGDDDAADLIGTNNGTMINLAFDAGEVDRAFTFDGMDSEADFGDTAGNFGTNDFTIDFWVKTTNTAPLTALLAKRTDCSTAVSLLDIRIQNGYLDYAQSGDADANPGGVESAVAITNGFYHHVALTRQGVNLIMYVDGLSNNAAASAGITDISNADDLIAGLSVCDGGPDGTVPFLGDLDELDLFNRALSPAEIYAIYHAGSLGKYSTNSVLPSLQVSVDGINTNFITLTNLSGPWQIYTNSFVTTNGQATIEFSGSPLSALIDDIQLIQLPATNYDNYYLPEEPLTPFVGEVANGCWTLEITDSRNDSSLLTNGALLSWDLQLTTSSTNASLTVLQNGVLFTTNVPADGIAYFGVDVPGYAQFATNTLTCATVGADGFLNLLFDQTALPTGYLPGDLTLTNDIVAGELSTNTLATQGPPPPLQPGQRYFLGVQNTSSSPATFSLEVNFDGMTNDLVVLTNQVGYTNLIGTNTVGTNGPQYYSFMVPTNATMVTFQLLNVTNGEADLYARQGLPLPGPLSFDYQSRNAGSNDQFIAVTTNSVPVPLPTLTTNSLLPSTPSTWYLAVYNFGAVSNVGYTVVATWVTSNSLAIIPLTEGVGYYDPAAPPGYPTDQLYSYTVTGDPSGIQFNVANKSGTGNVQLLVGNGIIPTPQSFYAGSFNAGTIEQTVQIGTNAGLPSLDGIWYLAVPNTSSGDVAYEILATNLTSLTSVPSQPAFLGASIASPTSGFTFYWSATPGATYAIDVSTNLINWTFVTNVTAASSVGSYTDSTPVNTQQERFFRLETQ